MKTINELIHQNAKTFDLYPDIIKSIIVKESGMKVFAGRYEPKFRDNYLIDKDTKKLKTLEELKGHIPKTITHETEYLLRATSFGLMQIMGQVAREKGFSCESLIELCKPELNIFYGCRHFKYLLDMKHGDIEKALLNWNGGGNPNYGKDVIAINNIRGFNKYNWDITGY